MSTNVPENDIRKLIDDMKSDYQHRFNVAIVVEHATKEKIRNAANVQGCDKIRAAWNEYICDPANEDSVDMGKFCWTSVMNKYLRIIGLRLAQKSGKIKPVYFYHCQNCNNQGASDTDRGDCLPTPCYYCKGRMIRSEIFEADKPLSDKTQRFWSKVKTRNPVWNHIEALWDMYPDKTLVQIQDLLPSDMPKAKIGFQELVDKFTNDDDNLDKSFL